MNINYCKPLIISLALIIVSSLSAQESCLLILDVQSDFYRNTSLEKQADEMIQNINNLIENHKESQEIIYMKTNGKILSISLKGIRVLPMFESPSVDSSLQVVSKNVFTKSTSDAFELEALNNFLTDRHISTVFITGLFAEGCVLQSSLGGLKQGYSVYIIPEALLSRTEHKKQRAIKKMKKKGVRLAPLNTWPAIS